MEITDDRRDVLTAFHRHGNNQTVLVEAASKYNAAKPQRIS